MTQLEAARPTSTGTGNRARELPPGPSQPALLQALQFIFRERTFMDRCVSRYGEMFTLTVPSFDKAVVITNPALAKTVFTADPDVMQAGVAVRMFEIIMGPQSLIVLDGAEHLQRRKLLLPFFHGSALDDYRRQVEVLAEEALDRFPVGEPFALLPEMEALTLEVIMRVVFGVEDAERLRELRPRLQKMLGIARSNQTFVRWALRSKGGVRRWHRLNEAKRQTDELVYAEIKRRRSDPGLHNQRDIMAMMLCARTEDGAGLDDGAVRDQLVSILLGGHETSARTLSWAFERLVRSPQAMRRLTAEVRSDNGDEYLEAVISETLRVRPPLTFALRRLAAPFELGGYMLPAGTLIVPAIASIHRRPDIYPEPDAFRPERFLESRPDTYAWIPFGGGTRRCLGSSFAYLEIKEALRVFLRRGIFEAERPEPEAQSRASLVMSPSRGARVILRQRD